MSVVSKVQAVRAELQEAAHRTHSVKQLMSVVAQCLHDRMLKYNWVGFYTIDVAGDERVLLLGPFVGSMTPHTRIPLNQGLCGAAASSGRTVVVDDVKSDPRYLACSAETQSEIVVPIFVQGKVVGELDIDSHFPAAFGRDDVELVEYCAALVGKHFEKFGG
jgi:L-methionine (R)-S-oxide reductase